MWEYNVGGSMRCKTADIASAVGAVMSEQLKHLLALLGAFDESGE